MSKQIILRIIFPVLIIIVLSSVYFFSAIIYKQGNNPLIQPVLGISTISDEPIVLAQPLWFPNTSDTVMQSNAPTITAKSAFFIEANSGQVLYQKDPNEQRHIASLTKIMTVIVTMQHKNFTDSLLVSKDAAEMEPDKMYLKEGEQLTIEELLHGIFLVSANDAAETLAEGVAGDKDSFVQLMNKTAAALGMKDTLFINPTGLEEDLPDNLVHDDITEKDQHSTAYDVALMARYAIKNYPHLIEISKQPQVTLDRTDTHRAYYLTSGINLLTTYPGVMGFKTGYTPQAGLTLVTYAKKGDKEVIGVLLDATQRREDAKAILDYSFKKLGVK